MDWLTFVVRLVEALAWPLIVGGVIWASRKEIRGLASHLQQFEAPGILKLTFEKALQEARELAVDAGSADYQRDPERYRMHELRAPTEHILMASLEHPRSAILVAWKVVEEAVVRAAYHKVSMSPMPDLSSPLKAVRALRDVDAISAEDFQLFHELRGLKNQVANIETFQPGQEASLEYVDLAGQLRERLERIARPNYSSMFGPDEVDLPLKE